ELAVLRFVTELVEGVNLIETRIAVPYLVSNCIDAQLLFIRDLQFQASDFRFGIVVVDERLGDANANSTRKSIVKRIDIGSNRAPVNAAERWALGAVPSRHDHWQGLLNRVVTLRQQRTSQELRIVVLLGIGSSCSVVVVYAYDAI